MGAVFSKLFRAMTNYPVEGAQKSVTFQIDNLIGETDCEMNSVSSWRPIRPSTPYPNQLLEDIVSHNPAGIPDDGHEGVVAALIAARFNGD